MSPLTASGRLRHKIDLVNRYVTAPNRAFLDDPRCAHLYVEFRITAYQISQAYFPATETIRERALALAPSDEVAAEIAQYLDRHIAEESEEDHLADLEVLGHRRQEIQMRPISPRVTALVGSAYYWALQHHPVAFLGTLEILEGYPPTVEIVETMIDHTGLPREAFSTMFEHADRDVRHRAELNDLIDALPLSREQESLMGVSALHTAYLMGEVLHGLLDHEGAVAAG